MQRIRITLRDGTQFDKQIDRENVGYNDLLTEVISRIKGKFIFFEISDKNSIFVDKDMITSIEVIEENEDGKGIIDKPTEDRYTPLNDKLPKSIKIDELRKSFLGLK